MISSSDGTLSGSVTDTFGDVSFSGPCPVGNTGGATFTGIRGAAFFDLGGGWDDAYTETRGSTGVGVRLNLLGALVLRYDVGKRIEHNLSRFQPGLFYQFFFGWDF